MCAFVISVTFPRRTLAVASFSINSIVIASINHRRKHFPFQICFELIAKPPQNVLYAPHILVCALIYLPYLPVNLRHIFHQIPHIQLGLMRAICIVIMHCTQLLSNAMDTTYYASYTLQIKLETSFPKKFTN